MSDIFISFDNGRVWMPKEEYALLQNQKAIYELEQYHAIYNGIFPLSVPENTLKWA